MYFDRADCTEKDAASRADEAHDRMTLLDRKLARMYVELDTLEELERDGMRHDEAAELRLRISDMEENANRQERIYDYWLMQMQWAV